MTATLETRDIARARQQPSGSFWDRVSWSTLVLATLLFALVALPALANALPAPSRGALKQSPASGIQFQEASISVSPATTEVDVGASFTVDIVIDPGAESVDSAQAHLEFDPSRLEVQQITGNGVLPVELSNSYNNTLGQIVYSAATFGSAASGPFTLVTVQIRALAASPGTQLSFTFEPPERRTKVNHGLLALIDHEHGVANNGNVTINGTEPTATSTAEPTTEATPSEVPTLPTATATFTPVPGGVAVIIDPSTATVSEGSTFTMDVIIQAGSQPVDSAQVYIDFDPTYLNVLGLTGGLTLTELYRSYDNIAGQIGYSAFTLGPGATGTFTLVTIEFQAMAITAGTDLTFGFTPPRETKVRNGEFKVLGSTSGAQVEIVASTPTPTSVPLGINDAFAPLVMKNHPTPTHTPVPTVPTITATATATGIPTIPTTTATPTEVPPDGCVDLITNGDMEETLAWIFGNCTAGMCSCPPAYTGETSHSPSRSVRVGLTQDMAAIPCFSSMRQRVTIPDGIESATLTYWYQPFTLDTELVSGEGYDWSGFRPDMLVPPSSTVLGAGLHWAAQDWQYVLILDERLEHVLDTALTTNSNSRVWTAGSFDLDVARYAGETVWVYFGVQNGDFEEPTWMYVDDVALIVCYETTPSPTSTPSLTLTATPTGSPTPTPSPTPTLIWSCDNIVSEGDFEDAESDAWERPILASSADYSTAEALEGVQSMRCGIVPPTEDCTTESSVYQTLVIPADAESVVLHFWYKPFTEDTEWTSADGVDWEGYDPAQSILGSKDQRKPSVSEDNLWSSYDSQQCLILNSWYNLLGTVVRLNSNSQTWTEVTHDLTAYRGRTIVLYFNVYNNGWENKRTWMYVDDVEVNACRSTTQREWATLSDPRSSRGLIEVP